MTAMPELLPALPKTTYAQCSVPSCWKPATFYPCGPGGFCEHHAARIIIASVRDALADDESA